MAITRVKCRAKVEIGGVVCETPFVQSFNVRKQRGQVSTFDASLKIEGASAASSLAVGGDVKIYAGQDSASTHIFSGICRAAKISPCYDDPKYVILSISGADSLSLLQGKKYTRRCRATKACWVAITSVVRPGLKSGKFAFNNEATMIMDDGNLEKEDPTVAFIGTSVDERTAPAAPADINNVNPPSMAVKILTTVIEAGSGGA